MGAAQSRGPIVALGDSITYGYGLPGVPAAGPAPAHSYPWDLSHDLGVDVVNAGVSGDMAREVLDPSFEPGVHRPDALRLPALLALHPRLVIVAFGTNEFWRESADQAATDLNALLSPIAAAGIPTVIAGTHKYPAAVWDPLLAALALKYHAGLVLGITDLPAADMSDQYHPNAAGYEVVAQRVDAAVLARLGGAPSASASAHLGARGGLTLGRDTRPSTTSTHS